MARRRACLALTFMALLITGASCEKSVKLEIIPEVVEEGHDATLRCHYDLEGKGLYSLKWYRGINEFYGYVPGDGNPIKIFNVTWIHVDPIHSNESQVVIRNVSFPLHGNFSCEITYDTSFYTVSDSKALTVVSIPKDKPVIIAERTRYNPGDTLRANCSTLPSKPPVHLSFMLNDVQVGEALAKQMKRQEYSAYSASSAAAASLADRLSSTEGRQYSEISLPLQPFHFDKGQLSFRCVAKIPDIYEESSEVLQLGSSQREPVPERVTSEVASRQCHRIAHLTLLSLVALLLHLR